MIWFTAHSSVLVLLICNFKDVFKDVALGFVSLVFGNLLLVYVPYPWQLQQLPTLSQLDPSL